MGRAAGRGVGGAAASQPGIIHPLIGNSMKTNISGLSGPARGVGGPSSSMM